MPHDCGISCASPGYVLYIFVRTSGIVSVPFCNYVSLSVKEGQYFETMTFPE